MKDKKIYWTLGGSLDLGSIAYRDRIEVFIDKYDILANYKNIYGGTELTKSIINHNFNYKFNSSGFRSQEFDLSETTPIILTLGCSFTMGIGVPQDKNWPEEFKNKYFPNYRVWNAAIATASADTIARLAVNIIPIAKPDIVAVMWPCVYRYETYNQFQPSQHGPNVSEVLPIENKDDCIFKYSNEDVYNNQAKNKIILELLQKVYGFRLLNIDWDDTINKVYNKHTWTKARDNIHYGVDWHQQMADDFYLQYSNPEEFALKYTDLIESQKNKDIK